MFNFRLQGKIWPIIQQPHQMHYCVCDAMHTIHFLKSVYLTSSLFALVCMLSQFILGAKSHFYYSTFGEKFELLCVAVYCSARCIIFQFLFLPRSSETLFSLLNISLKVAHKNLQQQKHSIGKKKIHMLWVPNG